MTIGAARCCWQAQRVPEISYAAMLGNNRYTLSSFFNSVKNRQSVPWARILLGPLLIDQPGLVQVQRPEAYCIGRVELRHAAWPPMAGGDFGQGRHSPGLSSGPFARAGSVVQPAANGPTTRATPRMPRNRRRSMDLTEPNSTTPPCGAPREGTRPCRVPSPLSATGRPIASTASSGWRC